MENVSSTMKNTVIILGCILFGFAIGMMFGMKNSSDKLIELSNQLESYRNKYETAILDKEKAKIDFAKEASKKPEVIYMKGDTETKIVYVEKENESDPDVKINTETPKLKLEYNGKLYNMQALKTSSGSDFKGGMLVANQSSEFKLDVTDVVNREINFTISNKDKEISQLKRQKIQNTVWGIVGGAAIGYLSHRK